MRRHFLITVLIGLAMSVTLGGAARATVIVKINGKTFRSRYRYHIPAADVFGPSYTGAARAYNLEPGDINGGNPDDVGWLNIIFDIDPGARGPAVCEGLQYAASVAGATEPGEWFTSSCQVRITRNVKRRHPNLTGGTFTVAQKLTGTFSGTLSHLSFTPGSGDVTVSGRFRTRVALGSRAGE